MPRLKTGICEENNQKAPKFWRRMVVPVGSTSPALLPDCLATSKGCVRWAHQGAPYLLVYLRIEHTRFSPDLTRISTRYKVSPATESVSRTLFYQDRKLRSMEPCRPPPAHLVSILWTSESSFRDLEPLLGLVKLA